jgi:arylsulfatase A-like enzyme
VTFTDVYSQSPKTTPSHMTLFTSLYPSVHGVELWEQGRPGHVLAPRVHTLAEVLKNAGYATAAFTGGAQMDPTRGFDHGFDVYTEHGQRRRALKWLGRHRRERFFVFYHTYEVHDPYLPPSEYIRQFAPDYRGPVLDAVRRLRAEGDASEAGWAGLATRFWQSVDKTDPRDVDFIARLYDAGIRRMDDLTVRALLDRLDELELANETLIVFTSDHGEAFGEHGRFLHEDLYGETLRVPLILRLPGKLAAGQRVPTRVRLLDVMPTVLDLLGVPAPPAMQGRSLVPLLDGGPDAPAVSEYVTPGHVFESIRRGPLSYVVEGSDARLFDLAKDPAERVDLASAQRADAVTMRAALDAWRLECRSASERIGPRDGATVAPSEETTRRLRALGYVE